MKKLVFLFLFTISSVANAEDVIQIIPKALTAGMTYEDEDAYLEVEMRNTTYDEIANLQFDLLLPDGVHYDDYYEFDGARVPYKSGRGGTTWGFSITIVEQKSGYLRFMFVPQAIDKVLKPITGNEGVFLRIYITTDDDIKPGVYPVKMTKTKFVKTETEGFYIDDNVSFIVIDGEERSSSVCDLGDAVVPSFVASELDGVDNVIAGGVCSNLVLTDDTDFSVFVPFRATKASYSRTMANQWGTIVLPYDVASNDDVAYYVPSGVEDDVLKLTQMDVLPANTPALVEKKNGDSMTATAQNVTVVSDIQDGVNGNVTMHGSYTNDTKVTDQNAYYIKNNKFWLNNEYFFIDAFRAYFTVAGAPQAKSLTISHDDASIIDALTGNGDVSISEYYDASGARNNNLRKGINIVRLCNGETKKIIVE